MSPLEFNILSIALFCIGIVGVISRRNIFVIYMSVELMLNAINLILAAFSKTNGNMNASAIALLMMAVIAAEAGVFLAIIMQLYRNKKSIDSNDHTSLSQKEFS